MKSNLGQATWCGKKFDDMTREELYSAMESMDRLRRADNLQHQRDIEMLRPR